VKWRGKRVNAAVFAMFRHIFGLPVPSYRAAQLGENRMDFTPYLIPGAATMAVLGMVYLLFVFWVRRPGRSADLDARQVQES
jgi:hypothetical protein